MHLLGRLEDQPHPARQRRSRLASASPAPSTIAVCTSCPQACRRPRTVDANGRSVASCSGSASMSARSATQRSPRPTSQTRPVPPGRVRGSRPAARQQRARRTRWCACSARPSSGSACSARRQADDVDRCGGEPGVQPGGATARADVDDRGRRRTGTTDASFSSTVTGPHRPSTLRGASAHTPHPDGGVPSRYDLLPDSLAKGLPICCGRARDAGPTVGRATTSGIFRRSSHRHRPRCRSARRRSRRLPRRPRAPTHRDGAAGTPLDTTPHTPV